MNKSIFIVSVVGIFFLLFFWYLVAYSFFDIFVARQNNFTTDKCTFIPNGTWDKCCIVHDKSYWQGGSKVQRSKADKQLYQCIKNTSNNLFAAVVYLGVRIGGIPYIAVPWRWGYGWDFGRGYR